MLFPGGLFRADKSSNSHSPGNHDEPYNATALWYKAEEVLVTSAEGDVLAIFDCCYASNAHKGYAEDFRAYELIAASPKDSTTPAPGENSFTSRLITSMRELLEEHSGRSFSTVELLARINEQAGNSGKRMLPALLHDRLTRYSGRHIKLARLIDKATDLKGEMHDQQPVEEAHLNLRFILQEQDLRQEQIEVLASELHNAFKKTNIQLANVEWDHLVQKKRQTVPDDILLNQGSVETAHLDLSFLLRQSFLDREQVEALSPELRIAFRKAKIRLISIDLEWETMRRGHGVLLRTSGGAYQI